MKSATPVKFDARSIHLLMRRPSDSFARDVFAGLSREPGRRYIPSKYLYDEKGSALFSRICELDEYYVTRLEWSILRERRDDIARQLGPDVVLVEPGAGDCAKAQLLLGALERPAFYCPVDLSASVLREASRRVAAANPKLTVEPACADFARGLGRLDALPRRQRVVFFPGSTIGNLDRQGREELLRDFARFVGAGGRVLVGFDMVKDRDVLRAAYDDREGVTAEFNLNLVDRMNNELGAGLDRRAFRHEAIWDEVRSRIEMRLVCERDQIALLDGRPVPIHAGERIHTENSCKFTPEQFESEAAASGLAPLAFWTDAKGWFTVALFESLGQRHRYQ